METLAICKSGIRRVPANHRQREAERLTPGARTRHARGTFSQRIKPIAPSNDGRERRCLQCGCWQKRGQLRRARARSPSLLKRCPPLKRDPPFTAKALLPLALAAPAVGGHRFGKGFSLSRIPADVPRGVPTCSHQRQCRKEEKTSFSDLTTPLPSSEGEASREPGARVDLALRLGGSLRRG
jgi:hypothetical protein